MDKWNEVRTAYLVAQLGTVSAASERLGVHRATVVRHIDALEETLGGRLFQRHARGYTLTEAGQDLLRVANATESQFSELAGRIRGRAAEVSGELVVTSIELLAPLLVPALDQFQQQNPGVRIHFEASNRLYRLEYGEAHIAVRAGTRPEHPDNLVQPFLTLRSGLYAHTTYAERHGLPASIEDYADHTFLGEAPNRQSTITQWLHALTPEARITFSSQNRYLSHLALSKGMGIGFFPELLAQRDPQLIEVHPPKDDWDVPLWLVTHIDLHWTPKVQAILGCLKAVPQ